ncbi:zinc finger protein 830-like [Lycorma delicatula]|uniref:zinc finger protein 830-like n=1 Tax=Lycorma delicatula TaxID=130591 RepID=UPI003F515BCF
MSSVSNGKTKLTQNDLRRFMSEQKKKLLLNETKVDSPLAKYPFDGQLMCVVCNSIVRSEKIWKVHINGKQHKENLLTIKQGGVPSAQVVPNISTKRSLPDETLVPTPPKKIKGILKNAPKPELPEGFFDSPSTTVNNVKISNETVIPLERLQSSINEIVEVNNNDERDETEEMEEDKPKGNSDIPEGFFDDPVLDAKARNVEYKDPIQDEWERFQKEIKEENTVSDQIIEVDQEEAIAERQIDEIDEQLRNWSRVLDLEVKKEKVQAETSKGVEDMDQDTASDDEGDFDEFLDWRAKRSFR